MAENRNVTDIYKVEMVYPLDSGKLTLNRSDAEHVAKCCCHTKIFNTVTDSTKCLLLNEKAVHCDAAKIWFLSMHKTLSLIFSTLLSRMTVLKKR